MVPKKNMILGVAFAIPLLCSLIGAGAFVLLVTPVAEEGLPGPSPNKKVEALQEEIKGLRAELQRINKLFAQLEEEQERVAMAQKVKELVDALESSTANLLGKLSGVGEELTVIEATIRSLDSSVDEEKTQRGKQKLVRSVPTCVPEFCLNRLAHTRAHLPHRNERG